MQLPVPPRREAGPRAAHVAARLLTCMLMLARTLALDSEGFAVALSESAFMPTVVSVLQTSDIPPVQGLAQVQAAACLTLRAVARHSDPQLYVVAAGAIPALMRIVRDQASGALCGAAVGLAFVEKERDGASAAVCVACHARRLPRPRCPCHKQTELLCYASMCGESHCLH